MAIIRQGQIECAITRMKSGRVKSILGEDEVMQERD